MTSTPAPCLHPSTLRQALIRRMCQNQRPHKHSLWNRDVHRGQASWEIRLRSELNIVCQIGFVEKQVCYEKKGEQRPLGCRAEGRGWQGVAINTYPQWLVSTAAAYDRQGRRVILGQIDMCLQPHTGTTTPASVKSTDLTLIMLSESVRLLEECRVWLCGKGQISSTSWTSLPSHDMSQKWTPVLQTLEQMVGSSLAQNGSKEWTIDLRERERERERERVWVPEIDCDNYFNFILTFASKFRHKREKLCQSEVTILHDATGFAHHQRRLCKITFRDPGFRSTEKAYSPMF